MVECRRDRKVLELYACGLLRPAETAQVESHLRAGCPECQRAIDAALVPWAELVADEEEAIWEAMFLRLEERLAQLNHERESAPDLLRELLALPAAERSDAVRRERRFQTLPLCWLLLERSCADGIQSPAAGAALLK